MTTSIATTCGRIGSSSRRPRSRCLATSCRSTEPPDEVSTRPEEAEQAAERVEGKTSVRRTCQIAAGSSAVSTDFGRIAMNAPLALAEVATITSSLIDGFAIDVARRCLDAGALRRPRPRARQRSLGTGPAAGNAEWVPAGGRIGAHTHGRDAALSARLLAYTRPEEADVPSGVSPVPAEGASPKRPGQAPLRRMAARAAQAIKKTEA
jgi:hypothetical protein